MNEITLCEKSGAAYIKISDEKILQTKEFEGMTILDYDENGKLIGIELIGRHNIKI